MFIFFEWAVLARHSMANPVQCQVIAPEARIQHYPIEILTPIARYMVSTDAEPTAALMLYLIVFHLVTVQEIRHLRIPEIISLTTRSGVSSVANSTRFTLPPRRPSFGIVHAGRRPAGQIIFHDAAQPWLRPLLMRLDAHRTEIAGPQCASRYVFVSPRGRTRDVPVSPVFVWGTVRRATQYIVGYSCNPNTLRKTAAVNSADRVGLGSSADSDGTPSRHSPTAG